MMSSSSANGAGGTLNGKIPQVESGEVDEPVGATTGVTNGDALPKGDVQKPPLPVQVDQPTVNGVSALSRRSSMSDLPPEIVQITEGYEPFGKLIARVVQECSNELNEVVDKLSNIAVPPPLTNGVSHVNGSGNMSQQNLLKKKTWLEFANSNREQFIKLMVISQWSRNADQVKKLIDLMFWSNGQTECYQRASDGLGELKRSLHSFKSPNPDIKTALEVLSTGKASWMPDLDYIPLEPLTPEELLRTIKSMNALLSMRLNLHEDLPIHLRNWKIKNGRATFTFPLEFEFDVTIANEDPTRQLYFVDIRFLFQPSAEVPEGQIRDVLQFKADEALLNSKIPGCAEFLRNFALTHQITTLRKQAVSMLQSTWTSAIRIEPIHRSLIIQYWTETSFPKSWIEIGIDSGVGKKRLRPGHVELPLIRARWKRYGVDVKDTELDLRLSNISMEQILKRAIAAHSIEVLRTAKDELQKSSSGSQLLRMELQESEDEPIDCMLKLQLGRFSPQITFAIEPISGQLCLQPSTIISRQAEWVLNSVKNPLAEVHEKLHTYLCLDMLWRIERQAQHADWHQVPSWRFDENYVKARFKCEVRRHGFFRPRGWANSEPNWAVAVTIELDGEKWWVVEVSVPPNYAIYHETDNQQSNHFRRPFYYCRPRASITHSYGRRMPIRRRPFPQT
jgi:mediator of RNA polymerase II transcription subunit 14